MESEIEALRRKREYYTRRLNLTCALSPAQAKAAVAHITRVRSCGASEAEAELARQRFVWDAMTPQDDAMQGALQFKHELLDAIEQAAPLRNPCHECYQKTPEAKAEKRKAADVSKEEGKEREKQAAAAAPKAKKQRIKLAADLPAVTSDNVTAGCVLPA
jgi:hypothetical protein